MNATAWLIRSATGELVTGYWSQEEADEYLDDYGQPGVRVERLDFEVEAP